MYFGSPWFIAQAISSIRHGMGSRFAFQVARRGDRWWGRRRRGIRQTLYGGGTGSRPVT